MLKISARERTFTNSIFGPLFVLIVKALLNFEAKNTANGNKTPVTENLVVICKRLYGSRRQMRSLAKVNQK